MRCTVHSNSVCIILKINRNSHVINYIIIGIKENRPLRRITLFAQHVLYDLPPLRQHCGEAPAPGRDLNPGRAA